MACMQANEKFFAYVCCQTWPELKSGRRAKHKHFVIKRQLLVAIKCIFRTNKTSIYGMQPGCRLSGSIANTIFYLFSIKGVMITVYQETYEVYTSDLAFYVWKHFISSFAREEFKGKLEFLAILASLLSANKMGLLSAFLFCK